MSGRIRSLKPEWLDDEPLTGCSDAARVLSIAVLLLADDYGNGRAGDLFLASRAFPGRPADVARGALGELVAMRFLVLYEIEGQRYYHVRNWAKHQKVQHPGKPLVPQYAHSQENGKRPSGDSHETLSPKPNPTPDPPESLSPKPEEPPSVVEALAPDLDQDQDQDQRPGPGPARARPARGGACTHEATEAGPDPPDDPGRETVCPADLAERLEKSGTVRALAEKLAVPIESVRHEIKQFEAYWVIGKGQGQKRTGWPGKARQWVVEQHAKPGGLKPPGAVAHDRRDGEYIPSAETAALMGSLLRRNL